MISNSNFEEAMITPLISYKARTLAKPTDSKSVQVLCGPAGKPHNVSVFTVDSANVAVLACQSEEIALTASPNGISVARTRTPESIAGKHRLLTWAHLRNFAETGELCTTYYAVQVAGTIRYVVPGALVAEKKVNELRKEGNKDVTAAPMSEELSAFLSELVK